MRYRDSPSSAAAGFTLIEIALVLFIIATITGAIAIPLVQRIESRRVENTQALLELAQERLLAYVTRTGYFPCPARDTDNGQEPSTADHSIGSCPEWQGFLPAAVLNWTPVDGQGFAVDAWGTEASRIRYAVSNTTVEGITNPFTRVNGLANAGLVAVSSTPLFQICSSGSGVNAGIDCGTAKTLASNAAVVLWSTGPNARTGGTSVDEAENPSQGGGSKDRIFVSREPAQGSGPEYDDLVRWIPGPALAKRLQLAGVMTPTSSGTGGVGGGGGTYGNNDSDDDND